MKQSSRFAPLPTRAIPVGRIDIIPAQMSFHDDALPEKAAAPFTSSPRERVDACALCGGRELEDLFSQTDFVYRTTNESFLHSRCRDCGLMFIRERPTPAMIGRHYPSCYSFYRPGRLESLKDAAKAVLGATFAPGASPFLSVLLAPLHPLARRLGWLNAVRSYRRPAFVPAPGTRLLDVGCGSGTTLHPFGRRYSLHWLSRHGVAAEGVEPSAHACAEARAAGLRVTQGDLLGADLPAGAYDAVRFNHSLEHVHDPAAYLARARDLLKPGGLLIISVPNYDGATYSLFPQAVEAPRHLFYFNPSSLRRHLEARGFDIVSLVTPPTPEVLLYILRAFAPEKAGALPPGEEVFALLPECQALADQGRGDDLDLVARKR